MSTVAERVAAGAAFLDEHDPDWWRADVERAIDLGTLDLSDSASCVLGQRCPVEVLALYAGVDPDDEDKVSIEWYQAYSAYVRHLSGKSYAAIGDWSADHGFTMVGVDLDGRDEWADLTYEWKRVITERRSAS